MYIDYNLIEPNQKTYLFNNSSVEMPLLFQYDKSNITVHLLFEHCLVQIVTNAGTKPEINNKQILIKKK